MNTQEKRTFIEFMMAAEVLRFGEFTTKSGRQTPYFVNTGNYRTGAHIAALGRYYADTLTGVCGGDYDALFGPAYKGIPLVTATAGALYDKHGIDKPFFFNRKEAKDHGEGGTLVGYQPKQGDRAVIIEDVTTAGTVLRETLPLLHGCGCTVRDMVISVNRCEVGGTPGKTAVDEVAAEFGIAIHPIVTVADIHAFLKEQADYAHVLPAMERYMAQYCIL